MSEQKRDVYIIDGARTPFIKLSAQRSVLSATDLALSAVKPLLARQPFSPNAIEAVVAGCVGVPVDEANIGRLIAVRAGCGHQASGWTVQRNCASGLQALDSAAIDIQRGVYDLVLAGGTECMSRTPILYSEALIQWFSHWKQKSGFLEKVKHALKLRPHFLRPIIGLRQALNDPLIGLSMGQTAEQLVYRFGLDRAELDAYALQSHERAAQARRSGYFANEIVPVWDWQGNVMLEDTGIREDSNLEKLAALSPVFDKPFGSITAGNSSQISDGAAFLILASQQAVERYALPVLGKIVNTAWVGLDPTMMGLGPAYAIQKLLQAEQLSVKDIDYWEINEAFAAQVLACFESMDTDLKIGAPDLDRVNVDGGAIAIGHPVGASGARLVLHLLQVLKRQNAKRGIASLCIGGGQGGAMLIEQDLRGI